MNTLEDRLRAALRTGAEEFLAGPDAWERIRARSLEARRRRGMLRWPRPSRLLIPAAAAAAVAAVIVVVTVAVNGVTGRSTGAPAGGAGSQSATPTGASTATATPGPSQSPVGPYSSSGAPVFFLAEDPPVSAVLALQVSAPTTVPAGQPGPHAVMAYSWIAYTSSSAWLGQLQGRQLCDDAAYPDGASSGFCVPLPQLGAGQLASVTASTDMGAKTGPVVLQGAAASQVTSVTAVLPGGKTVSGVVKTGRGFPYNAWAVAYPQATGVRLVFGDASGAEVASLGTAGPAAPPQVARPSSGGIVAFTYPKVPGIPGHAVMAYLIDGYVGFWQGSGNNGGYMSPQLAAGPPVLAGLSLPFWAPGGTKMYHNRVWEAFGYAHADVARVVVHLPNGQQVSTSTFAAGWPGSGLRLWAVRLPLPYGGRGEPAIDGPGEAAITGYGDAGNVVARATLGSTG